MRKGEKIKIYCDPISEKIFEGTATLISKIISLGKHDGRSYEMWDVMFAGENHTHQRKILEPKSLKVNQAEAQK